MSKGRSIREYITKGLTDQGILALVDTTTNSIRWHRSKMKFPAPRRSPRTSTKRVPTETTVGEALERFGLADEAKAAIARLSTDCADTLYAELSSWSFVVNHKAVSRYGQCSYHKKTLEVHEVLIGKSEDLKQTFFHECSHALDHMMNGRSSHHGRPWQHIMANGFGLSPIRCGGHSDEVREAANDLRMKKAVETWVCTRCDHEAAIMRKRKHPASAYTHNKCGGRFRVKPA